MRQPQLFPSKTWNAKTRRDPARFVHKTYPIQSRGLDRVSQSAIFGWWCSDEPLFHGRKSLSKCFPRYSRANSISQQPDDSFGGHNGARTGHSDCRYFFPPAFGWNEYQILNPTHCVYTTQHNTTQRLLPCKPTLWAYRRRCSQCQSCRTAERQLWTGRPGHTGQTQRPKTPERRSACVEEKQSMTVITTSSHVIILMWQLFSAKLYNAFLTLDMFSEWNMPFRNSSDGINHNTPEDGVRNGIYIFITFRGLLLMVLIHFSYFEARDIRLEASSLDFLRCHRCP